jgi:hypothetical protein
MLSYQMIRIGNAKSVTANLDVVVISGAVPPPLEPSFISN